MKLPRLTATLHAMNAKSMLKIRGRKREAEARRTRGTFAFYGCRWCTYIAKSRLQEYLNISVPRFFSINSRKLHDLARGIRTFESFKRRMLRGTIRRFRYSDIKSLAVELEACQTDRSFLVDDERSNKCRCHCAKSALGEAPGWDRMGGVCCHSSSRLEIQLLFVREMTIRWDPRGSLKKEKKGKHRGIIAMRENTLEYGIDVRNLVAALTGYTRRIASLFNN